MTERRKERREDRTEEIKEDERKKGRNVGRVKRKEEHCKEGEKRKEGSGLDVVG